MRRAIVQSGAMANPYRELPALDRLLDDERLAPLAERHGREALARIGREVLGEYRAAVGRAGG